MLFGETVAVYCENHKEHRYTVCPECRVRTSQETHYVSITKPNRLMLFGETVAVYCENHTNTQIHCVGRMQSPYLTGNTLHLYCGG
jgi:translation initiation factor IF-1